MSPPNQVLYTDAKYLNKIAKKEKQMIYNRESSIFEKTERVWSVSYFNWVKSYLRKPHEAGFCFSGGHFTVFDGKFYPLF